MCGGLSICADNARSSAESFLSLTTEALDFARSRVSGCSAIRFTIGTHSMFPRSWHLFNDNQNWDRSILCGSCRTYCLRFKNGMSETAPTLLALRLERELDLLKVIGISTWAEASLKCMLRTMEVDEQVWRQYVNCAEAWRYKLHQGHHHHQCHHQHQSWP